jgi:hypothetical protein
MKKDIVNKISFTFFPTSTAICKMFDLETAAVYGRIWCYCCQKGECYASKSTIGEEVGLSTKTVERRITILLENKYINDETPGIRNRAHTYTITDIIDDIDDIWKERNKEKDKDVNKNSDDSPHLITSPVTETWHVDYQNY